MIARAKVMVFIECTTFVAPHKSRVFIRVDLHRKAVERGIAEACPSAEETSDYRFVGKDAKIGRLMMVST
jgi:hypothetical protein